LKEFEREGEDAADDGCPLGFLGVRRRFLGVPSEVLALLCSVGGGCLPQLRIFLNERYIAFSSFSLRSSILCSLMIPRAIFKSTLFLSLVCPVTICFEAAFGGLFRMMAALLSSNI
jgi:hypothetical protein